MQIRLGETIRALRKRDGRTQEELAASIGVTPQAVSRWEMEQGYPDMELVPAIANYFGVYIDELFGYDNARDAKINEYILKYDALLFEDPAKLPLIRQAVAEFPNSDKLLIRLAESLNYEGWHRYGARCYNTEDCEYALNDVEYNAANPFWQEELAIVRRILAESKDPEIRERATSSAIFVMWETGQFEEAKAIANAQPSVFNSRETLLTCATQAEECMKYIGEGVLSLTRSLKDMVTRALSMKFTIPRDKALEKVEGLIALYHALFENGDFYFAHNTLMDLHLYAANCAAVKNPTDTDSAYRHMWAAKEHAAEFDRLWHTGTHRMTGVLFSEVECDTDRWESTSAETLLERLSGSYLLDVPAIKEDPRWDDWMESIRNSKCGMRN